MATLARRTLKLLLFIGLFWLAILYVHTYPLPLTVSQQHILIEISRRLRVEDYEFLYICSMTILDLIVAIIAYVMILKVWRRYVRSRSNAMS